jgi:transposase
MLVCATQSELTYCITALGLSLRSVAERRGRAKGRIRSWVAKVRRLAHVLSKGAPKDGKLNYPLTA